MGDSLNPSPLHRLNRMLRPDWARTVAARRAAAGALVVLAAVAALRDDPRGEQVDVLVASRDLSPGTALTAADVRSEKRTTATVPDGGSAADLDTVVGATLTSPVRRGEVLTDVRLLGPRLAESTAGPDARIVPLTLADAAVLDLLRPGDVVDIVAAAPDTDSAAKLVATGAIVVLVSAETSGLMAGNGGRVVLVALPAAAARTVAAAALVDAIGLTLH